MKKKNGNLSELMRFAGRHKYLTYSSWVLSVVSAAFALVPFVYIFFIIKEAIEVAPDFRRRRISRPTVGWRSYLRSRL